MGSGTALHRQRRSSTADKERVARRLRDACVEERISQDTFMRRLDLAFSARTHDELDWLVADLPEPTWITRALIASVERASRWSCQIAAAWREPRTLRLTLPTSAAPLTLGRSRVCDCVIADPTVSARHATLRWVEERWSLQDVGSTNGTFLNGSRITDLVEVRPGDEIALGHSRFILAPPSRPNFVISRIA
ncbi:MAG: FHA domain-containing protein [Actinobacteria bacterium]|nr:FHA domain-containing protein [Actinomycetota bacterium]